MLNASIRVGLYEPVRNLIVPEKYRDAPPMIYKILSGMITGALGICVANPTDVVKIRL
jgi:solute carrier family 25 uncoupling protein 8/9